ncbi:heavy metal-binding domain-containing protein [Escherichia coli]|nr:heavy metal-binding domain-containing protein [Escherichia coli]
MHPEIRRSGPGSCPVCGNGTGTARSHGIDGAE